MEAEALGAADGVEDGGDGPVEAVKSVVEVGVAADEVVVVVDDEDDDNADGRVVCEVIALILFNSTLSL